MTKILILSKSISIFLIHFIFANSLLEDLAQFNEFSLFSSSSKIKLEILRRAGAMPISSRLCGMITKREAERLCKSFLGDNTPPKLPENFAFEVKI